MTNCPCCSNQMLRHIRLQQTYWFCRHCWQEMPNLILKENNLKHDKLQVFSQLELRIHSVMTSSIYQKARFQN
ncbi:hypothetical protein [Nostoc sp.]